MYEFILKKVLAIPHNCQIGYYIIMISLAGLPPPRDPYCIYIFCIVFCNATFDECSQSDTLYIQQRIYMTF